MAKKKIENIKAAPVLRAGSGGEQPTPTPEQTGTRTYQIMDPWKDRDVVNLVDVKAVDGEITDVKVNGEPAGGGGTSFGPFSVTLHYTVAEPEEISISWDCIGTAGQFTGVFYGARYMEGRNMYRCVNESETFTETGTSVIKVISASPSLRLTSDNVVSVDGSATLSGTTVRITGDCDIYLTAE